MFQATLTEQDLQDNPTVEEKNSDHKRGIEQTTPLKRLTKLFWAYTKRSGEADTRSYRGLL